MPLSAEEWRALSDEFDAELNSYMEEWSESLRASMEAGDAETKSWDESKHPRGGNADNPGQFSSGQGSGGKKPAGEGTRPEPKPERSPSLPIKPVNDVTRPHEQPKEPRTQSAGRERSPAGEGSGKQPSSSPERSPLHRSLEQSPAIHARPLQGSGSGNEVALIDLKDGTKAVFKSKRGETTDVTRHGVPVGTMYKREVAASRLADALGFGDLVPTTTVRDQGGDIGSAQAFVDGEKAAKMAHPWDGPIDAARAAVYDYIIGHLDRHVGNWLVKDDKLALIDNGASLPTKYDQNDFFNMKFWQYAETFVLPMPKGMKKLADKWPEAEKALRESGIEDEAIALAKQRFDAVTSGKYRFIRSLPSLIPEDQREAGDKGTTLGEMAVFYDRPARFKRLREQAKQGTEGEDAR